MRDTARSGAHSDEAVSQRRRDVQLRRGDSRGKQRAGSLRLRCGQTACRHPLPRRPAGARSPDRHQPHWNRLQGKRQRFSSSAAAPHNF